MPGEAIWVAQGGLPAMPFMRLRVIVTRVAPAVSTPAVVVPLIRLPSIAMSRPPEIWKQLCEPQVMSSRRNVRWWFHVSEGANLPRMKIVRPPPLIVESSTSTSCDAPALLWPWICSAASSVAPPSRVTPWNAKLLEPSSMTVAVNWMSRNERWSELVNFAPAIVTRSPAAASTNTNEANLRFEIVSVAYVPA